MSAPPIPCVWTGEAFQPLRNFHNIARAHYGEGECVTLEPHEERSDKSHDHQFAWLKDAWQTLPEAIAADYPSPTHLRKRALIAAGWCDVRDYACASRAEAQRLASTLRGELDDYTVVIVRDAVVRVCRAKSQAKNKMKAADFQRSKSDIIEYVARLLDVAPETLARTQEAA